MKIVFQDDVIERFIDPHTMGVAGASDNKDKFGYLAYRELKMRGYTLLTEMLVRGIDPSVIKMVRDQRKPFGGLHGG
jgi:hypothetical protein